MRAPRGSQIHPIDALAASLVVLGCSASVTPEPTARPARQAPPSESAAPHQHSPHQAATPPLIERVPNPGADPSLTVRNDFPIPQHVFVDWVHRGELEPKGTRTFELTAGTHTVTCADSSDPDRNPLTITESFDAGYAYSYVIVPR
ncbi:MAG TPA: hypothetical protein VLC09_12005 [Polyangiaceae bacterium]|nr:hypothetical protein [Polyangiaceae bacterium]